MSDTKNETQQERIERMQRENFGDLTPPPGDHELHQSMLDAYAERLAVLTEDFDVQARILKQRDAHIADLTRTVANLNAKNAHLDYAERGEFRRRFAREEEEHAKTKEWLRVAQDDRNNLVRELKAAKDALALAARAATASREVMGDAPRETPAPSEAANPEPAPPQGWAAHRAWLEAEKAKDAAEGLAEVRVRIIQDITAENGRLNMEVQVFRKRADALAAENTSLLAWKANALAAMKAEVQRVREVADPLVGLISQDAFLSSGC